MSELDEATLIAVLTEPKDCLVKQYQKLFRLDNVGLEFTPEALKEIAKIAKAKNTGARGLRSVLEGFMIDIMYHLPDYAGEKVIITDKVVLKQEEVFPKNKAA